MSPRYELFYDGKVIATACTSYSVTSTEDFLLITTFNSRLHVVGLEEVRAFVSSNSGGSVCQGGGRLIEKGALLVGHEPGSTGARVWLQMPRGNLEQVSPRELLLERIKILIERREYRNALVEMRRHRIDMNLVHDHG